MSEFNRPTTMTEASADSLQAYVARVFLIMGLGLFVTTAVAFFGYFSLIKGGIVYQLLSGGPLILLVLFFVEIGIAIALGRGITSLSSATCRLLFFAYSAITGITFSVIPAAYGLGTLFVAFLFATVLFASCAVIGYTTKVDLTKYTGILMGGLIAVILLSVISIFVPVLRDNLLIGYVGLILFLALTAYDMQKIKVFYYNGDESIKDNLAVYAAFELYLDFINILIYILRILGSRNRK